MTEPLQNNQELWNSSSKGCHVTFTERALLTNNNTRPQARNQVVYPEI